MITADKGYYNIFIIKIDNDDDNGDWQSAGHIVIYWSAFHTHTRGRQWPNQGRTGHKADQMVIIAKTMSSLDDDY